MLHSYDLTVSNGDAKDAKRLLQLSVTFHVTYSASREITREFFEVFRTTSLPLQVAPFARAWIHDHCLRMGVPPLIMPLVRAG
jgi:preprotein translocase subunit SecB